MDPTIAITISAAVVTLAALVAYTLGRRGATPGVGETGAAPGQRLEEYPFYPFRVTSGGHVEFDASLCSEGVRPGWMTPLTRSEPHQRCVTGH